MTDFVIDASITAVWILPDEQSDFASALLDRLVDSEAFVPALWQFEIRNIILMAARRGRLTDAMAVDAFRFASSYPLTVDTNTDHEKCGELAREFQLTYYDAAYLELATRRNLPLATFDKALVNAATRLGLLLALD